MLWRRYAYDTATLFSILNNVLKRIILCRIQNNAGFRFLYEDTIEFVEKFHIT